MRENVRTTMGLNLLNICLETKIYSWSVSVSNIKKILTNKKRMGDTDVWKCWLLQEYIYIRDKLRRELKNTEYIDTLISSLCTS